MLRKLLWTLALASVSSVAWGNYLGMLRPPAGFVFGADPFAFGSPALLGLSTNLTGNQVQKLKLGYQPSPYFAIQGQYVDAGRASLDPFRSPSSFASDFRGTGFGVDAIARLPVWSRFSLYGRLGAYRGDVRPAFAPYSNSLIVDNSRSTRVRYGLGMGYDFSKSLGVRAEYERFAPLGGALSGETDADVFSVGVLWRF